MNKHKNILNEIARQQAIHTRREFLNTTASGLGMAGLGAMLTQDGLMPMAQANPGITSGGGVSTNPLAPKAPHYNPKAKACICIYMAGAPSHLDLFDHKPKLNELNGQPVPDSFLENFRFAFIKAETARLLGSKRTFKKHGQCGMELSDLLPHIGSVADDILLVRSMHTEQFNHHPGQLLMQCGRAMFGLPSTGSWLAYGLGCESQNLPGYVVLTNGRGASGGATLWTSGFLPSVYSGVLFRNQGEPVLNLSNPVGMPDHLQRGGLDALRDLNTQRYQEIRDPEIASRIAAYELAFRMQSAAPELIDLSTESQSTLDMYGVNRDEPEYTSKHGGNQGGGFSGFGANCLLARRMVERGVRFVNIIHASWDHHNDLDNSLKYNATMADQPVAALIKDLKQRGMLDETMVVWASEFGRTPLGENRNNSTNITGRDHHPNAYSIFMAGGGIKGGQVYGQTDEIGWDIVENPVHANDMHATMLHQFGLDHLKLTHRFQGRDFRLTDIAGRVMGDWIA